jgi:hypothetical protein
MRLWPFALLIGSLAFVGGCPLLSDVQTALNGPDNSAGPPLGNVGDLTSGLDAPPVTTGQIRVRFLNDADVDADVRLTMRVAGQMVHQAKRRVPGDSSSVFVGPDRADSILVEITQLKGTGPRSLPARALFLGLNFNPNELIDIRIEGDPPVVVQPQDQPPPDTPPIIVVVDAGDTLDVIDLDITQFIPIPPNSGGPLPSPSPIPPPGGVAPFPGWPPGGPPAPFPGGGTAPAPDPGGDSGGVVIDIAVDSDSDPSNGNEILLPVEPTGDPGDPLHWDPSGLPPGLYLVYTDQLTDGAIERVGPAPSALRVNSPPTLEIVDPPAGERYAVGDAVPIRFVGKDEDDDARITLFLDVNTSFDGDEMIILDGISEEDPTEMPVFMDTAALAPGKYYVGGVIDDGAAQAVAYSGPIEIVAK